MNRHTKYRRTKKGLVAQLHCDQKRNSKRRNHRSPAYTTKELTEWALSQEIFHILHKEWVEHDYNRWKRPSFDRKEDSKPYSISNIQIMTSYDNLKKQGTNPKPVKQLCGGEVIGTYDSILEAERKFGYPEGKSKISLVCKGIRKSYKGFMWEFVNKGDMPL